MIPGLLAAAAAAGGGGGGGLDPDLVRDVAGLVFSDDFVRADNTVIGNGWSEVSGDWAISSNRLRGPSDNTATTRSVEKDLGVALTELFVQVKAGSRNSGDTADSAIHRVGPAVLPVAGTNGYHAQYDKLSNDLLMLRIDADVHTALSTDASGGVTPGLEEVQLYCAASVQEGRSGDSGQGSVSTTSATHGFSGNTRIQLRARHPAGGNSAARPVFTDLMALRTRNIVVTGLSAGYKIRVLNLAAGTVLEVVESGGTATLNMMRGSASEYVPFAGWAKIQVLSGANVLLTEIVGSVYPGDQYSYTE